MERFIYRAGGNTKRLLIKIFTVDATQAMEESVIMENKFAQPTNEMP